MEGVVLTIVISIVVPLLLVLLWLFVMFFVIRKCLFNKRELVVPNEEDDNVPSRPHSVCPSTADQVTNSNHHLPVTGDSEPPMIQRPPPYSTLPRNSVRAKPRNTFSRYDEDESRGSHYGYRISSAHFSPFTRGNDICHSDAMRAVTLYCDRYVEGAFYESPPNYQSRENMENSDQARIVSGEELARTELSYYACETWI